MKKIIILLSILAMAVNLQVSAQAKKTKTQPAKKASTKSSPVAKKAPTTTATKQSVVAKDDYYQTALGLKLLYGISITGKHFVNKTGALEAVIQYRDYTGVGSEFNFTALYEYYGSISGAEGLRWYAGGGAYVGFFSSSYPQADGASTSSIGPTGIVGLEYKLKGIPLAFSADWQPIYIVNGNSGLIGESGGIGVKYTF